MFKKLEAFFEKNSRLIKGLFILSVLVFVLREVGKILSQTSWEQIHTGITEQNPLAIVAMVIGGFIAVTPMLMYDVVINELLPGKYQPKEIIKSGWIVNTFTNIAGFGGVLGASLRAIFYAKDATKRQILEAISKISLFLLSGLSIWCGVALVIIFGFNVGAVYGKYWPALILGGLYFPALLLITKFKKNQFFGDLTIDRKAKLLLGSTLEWGFCTLFFVAVGYLMGQHHLAAIIPMFIIASLLGVVSMVPGGLGSFDVFMILGLQMIGINSSMAVVWLLFYRICYYILPFAVGLIMLIHDTGSRINDYFDGLLKNFVTRLAQLFLTLFMYFSGIMMLLFSVMPNVLLANRLYQRLMPFGIFFLNQLVQITVGFAIIALAKGVKSRVKKSFWPAALILVISIVMTLWEERFPFALVLLLGVVLISLFLSKNQFYREGTAYSWGEKIGQVAIFISVFTISALSALYTASLLKPHHALTARLRFSSPKVWLLGAVGILISAILIVSIAKYLSSDSAKFLKQRFDERRIKAVIDKFGGNEISHLAFLKDKTVYYYQVDGEDQVLILFKKKANKLMVMGEPFGNQDLILDAISDFMVTADKYGLIPVFYEIDEQLTMKLHNMGFDFIMTGEEGYVAVDEFSLSGKRRRGERSLMNKLERDNYQFEVLQPPFDNELMNRLKTISDEWLHGQTEKNFSLGFFDPYYINQAPVGVLKNADQEVMAFITLMPTGTSEVISVDLMRYADDAPAGSMDALFIHMFAYAKENDFKYFNMGMAPLSSVGESRFSFLEERVAHFIYRYGQKLYSFQGLKTYKDKYVTDWKPKYIAYRKNNSLIFTMLQIMWVINIPNNAVGFGPLYPIVRLFGSSD